MQLSDAWSFPGSAAIAVFFCPCCLQTTSCHMFTPWEPAGKRIFTFHNTETYELQMERSYFLKSQEKQWFQLINSMGGGRGAIHLLQGKIINTTNFRSLSASEHCWFLPFPLSSLGSNKNRSLAGNDLSEMSASKHLINQFLRLQTAF